MTQPFVQTQPGLAGPNVQFHQAPVLFHGEGLGAPVAHGFAFGPCVLKPTSRGSVVLRSPDPSVAPRITHNYLTTSEDRRAIIDGLRLAQEIARQPSMKAVISGEFEVPEGSTDSDLLTFATRTGQTLYHPTSSCAIGSVVTPGLKVLGFDNLRVADASVMPSVIRGNTNAPSILIGERAAEFITHEAAGH